VPVTDDGWVYKPPTEDERIVALWKVEWPKDRARLSERASGWAGVGWLAVWPLVMAFPIYYAPRSGTLYRVLIAVFAIVEVALMFASWYFHRLKLRFERQPQTRQPPRGIART
jgi:hypothetical protein